MSRNTTRLPILPTPGMTDPRHTRLRFMTADAGAAGTAGAADATAVDSGAADSTDTAPTGATEPQAGTEAATGDTSDNPWSDPTKAQAEIERLRRENAAARTNAKATAAQEARDSVLQEFGKALGFINDGDGDKTPDAEQLTKAAQEAADDARQARVELAVVKAAPTLGADVAALLDSRSFLAKVGGLDPKADDFATQVTDAIKRTVQDNPKLLAQAQAAGSSSSDHAGGSGEAPDASKAEPGIARAMAAYAKPR